jgi:hypothetical protein
VDDVVKWIVIGVIVLAVISLIVSVLPVLGRLSGLRRAMGKVQQRQAEALSLQQGAATLQASAAELESRVAEMQERLAGIQAGGASSRR